MRNVTLDFRTYVVPKKNSKTPRVSRYGKVFLQPNPRAVESENSLHSEAWGLWFAAGGDKPTSELVEVRAIFKKTRADLIGVLETILDALQGVVYENDKQVAAFTVQWDHDGEILPEGVTCRLAVSSLYA